MFGNRRQCVRGPNIRSGGLVAMTLAAAACGGSTPASPNPGPTVEWSPPERVVTLTEENQWTGPRVALDARGDVVLGWRQISRPGGEHVAVVRQEDGIWSDPVNLGPAAVGPQVATTPSGTALVTWNDPTRRCVFGAVGERSAWSVSPVDCDRTPFPFPELAMGTLGHGVVAWQADVGPWRTLRATRWSERTGWAAPVELDHDQYSPLRDVAAAPDGRTMVVWAAGPPGLIATGLKLAIAPPEGAWGAPQPVPGAGRDLSPRLTTDAASAPFVAWFGEGEIGLVHLGPSGWSTPLRLPPGQDFCLDLAGGRPGEALLGWRAGGVVQVSRIQDGRPTEVHAWPGTCPRLRADAKGNAVVVWTTQATEDAFVSWVVVGTPDGRWSEARRVGGPADRVGAITAALRDGQGVLAWLEMTGTVVSLHVQRLRFPE
jgi:hypothetical protein